MNEPNPTNNPEKLKQPEYDYRPGQVSDAPAIQLVIERAIAARKGEFIASDITRPDYIEENAERLSRESTWSMLAFAGDKLVGLAMGEPAIELITGEIVTGREDLILLMVDPDHWGLGIGGELLDRLENELASNKVQSIELWTGVDNQRSRALYERKGYKLTGAEDVRHGNLHVQFEKYLTNQDRQ